MVPRKLARRTALVSVGTIAAVLVTASPALAATSQTYVNTDGTRAGRAWFNSGPNYWDIQDAKCDGKSVNLHYFIAGSWSALQHSAGCGTTGRYYLTRGSAGQQLSYYLRLTTSFAQGPTVTDRKG